jgi:hypothetical protein
MRSVAFCLCCVAFAQAATQKVTVLVNFQKPHSAVSVEAFRQELKDLLEPAGVTVELMLRSELGNYPEFSELVVFEMKGSCSMDAASMPPEPTYDERGPLAKSYSSEGQILHFGEVECDRVRQCLQRVMGRGQSQKDQAPFGTALGIVVAHELYHMIAGEKAHTKSGLTKESLSARDLLNGGISIPRAAREALRRSLSSK